MLVDVIALWLLRRWRDQRGEGVISTAIAVLVVAFLGAAMYLVFTQVLNDSGSKASTTVNNIGGP
jgi:hypothetical protein